MASRFGLGSAEFELIVNNEQLLRGFAQSQAQAQAASKKMADAIDAEMRRIEGRQSRAAEVVAQQAKRTADVQIREAQRAARAQAAEAEKAARAQHQAQQAAQQQLRGQVGGALAFGAGAAGLTLGAAAVQQTIQGITEATQRSTQAQFALSRTFGATMPEMARFSEQLARATGKSAVEMQEASVQAGTLQRNYGLTTQQVQELIKRSADLAAVHGFDVADATQRATAAIRGEAEAAEQLGLTLNSDAVKAMANMTEEQRKNFETLDATTKAQIIYNELMRQSEHVQGAAAERANSAAGAFDKLGASLERLGKTTGEFSTGPIAFVVGGITSAADAAERFLRVIHDIEKTEFFRRGVQASLPGASPATGLSATGALRERTPFLAEETGGAPAQLREAIGVDIQRGQQEQVRLAQQLRQRAQDLAESEIKGREAVRDRTLEALQREQESIRAAAQNRREEIETARDEEIRGIQDAERAELRSLEVRQQSVKAAFETRIQDAQAARDTEVHGVEAARDAALRALEEEERDREQARRGEDRAIEDANAAELRGIEQRHDAALRAIEDEQRAIEARRDTALAAIEEELEAEQRRHETVIDNLDRELAAQLSEVDDRIEGLRHQERLERQADTDRRLRRTLSEAKGDLREAGRSGDRRAIEQARRAVRDAERAIEREEHQRRREALLRGLEYEKDIIREEIKERKQAEQQQTAATREGLEDRKEATQTAAQAALDQLAQRRDAEQRANEELLQLTRDRYEQEARIRDDARRAEDAEHALRVEAAREAAQAQVEAIKAAYDAPGGVIETIRRQAEAADLAFAAQRQAIQDNARDAQLAARQTADEQIRQLDRTTAQQVQALNERMRNERIWADQAIAEIRRVASEWEKLNNLIRGLGANLPGGLRSPALDEPAFGPSSAPANVAPANRTSQPGTNPRPGAYSGPWPGPTDLDYFLRKHLFLTPGTQAYIDEYNFLVRSMEAGNPPPSGMPLTGRQHGGPMERDRWYLVGEGGRPELVYNNRVYSHEQSRAMLGRDLQPVEVTPPSLTRHAASADQTRTMLQDVRYGGSPSLTIVQNNYGVGYEVEDVIARANAKSLEDFASMLHDEVFSGPHPTRRTDPLGY